MTLLDIAEAKDQRDDGIQRASAHAVESWKWHAEQAILRAARKLPELTVDDCQLEMPVGITTHEGRAMGGVMLAAVRSGVLEKTDKFKASNQPKSHCNPRRVWRSLVYRPERGQVDGCS